jgi:hypothetical protein
MFGGAIKRAPAWSFPSEIVVPTGNTFLPVEWVTQETLRILKFDSEFNKEVPIGTIIKCKTLVRTASPAQSEDRLASYKQPHLSTINQGLVVV